MIDKSKLQMGVEVDVSTASVKKKIQNASLSMSSGAMSNRSGADENTPFNIVILGDFSGRGNGPQAEKSNRLRFIEIDRDNFEERMAEFNIQLNVNLNDERIQLKINELEDFHPDELYEQVESFSQLRSLHRRLKNNKTFADAATEIQSWMPQQQPDQLPAMEPEATENGRPPRSEDAPAAENLLDSLLNSHQASQSTETSQIDRLIRSIVAPYVEPAADPRQDEMIEMVDKATATHMRDILHSAEFQALESTWQSLWFLITRLETGSRLKIKLLDISQSALQAELAVDDMASSDIYKLFCDQSQGDEPWGVILGNYRFTDRIEDVLTLAGIGDIAQRAGAPFIAAANEALVGCDCFAQKPDYDDWDSEMKAGVESAWQMLRESSVAHYLGLALPGFLLRLPYGKKSNPIESFRFEEMTDEHCHDCYLWGNAAFLKVECLAQNFNQNGWAMRAESVYQTEDLPLHYYADNGETVVKPAAEIFLTEKGGEILNQQGLIAVFSVKNADVIRSSDYRSLALDGKTLQGRWRT